MKYVFSLSLMLLVSSWSSTLVTGEAATATKKHNDAYQEILNAHKGLGYADNREDILANRERRKRQLKNLVNDHRKKLADHSAGEVILEPEDKASMERRMDLYSRKLDSMQGEMDERDIERIIAREQSSARRRHDRNSRSRPNILGDESKEEL